MRLNFLSSLLHEAYDHLHQHLTASVLGVKLLLLPFHRDVNLTPAAARAMRAAVSHCQRVRHMLDGLLSTALCDMHCRENVDAKAARACAQHALQLTLAAQLRLCMLQHIYQR